MIKKWYKRVKRNLKVIWLRFRINCYKGSIAYADKKLDNKFDITLYKQRKLYLGKLQDMNNKLFNMRRN